MTVVELDALIDKISKLAVDDSGGDGDSVEKHLYVLLQCGMNGGTVLFIAIST